MVVKYQVERRPIALDGTVYYGAEPGNGVAVLTSPKNESLSRGTARWNTAKGLGPGAQYYTMNLRAIQPNSPAIQSHIQEQIGEPWVVHSTHHSIDSAIESAAPLASAIGSGNVRIIKVLNHTTEFKLN